MCTTTKAEPVPSGLIVEEKDYEYPSTCRPHPLFETFMARLVTASIVVLSMTGNLWLRWSANYKASGDARRLPWLSLAMDAFVLLSVGAAFFLFGLPTKKRKQYFLKDPLENNQVLLPRVDVFLPMCKEDLAIQQATIEQVLQMNYPADRLRVFVLDDGGCDDLKQLCQTLARQSCGSCHKRSSNGTNGLNGLSGANGISCLKNTKGTSCLNSTKGVNGSNGTNAAKGTNSLLPVLTYHCRPRNPGKPHHGKAGNVNFGLAIANREEEVAKYIMIVDVDMLPVENFLRRMLPHLMLDNKVAIACPPQRFYNIPYGDPLGQDVAIFADVLQPRLDVLNCTPAIGHGMVLKRSAIERVGGMPTGDTGQGFGEDFNVSIHLFRKGYTVAHVHEDLLVGLQPDSLAGHIRQRSRWYIGAIYTALEHGCFVWNCDGLTLFQRVVTIQYTFLVPMSMLLQFINAYVFSIFLLISNDTAIATFSTRSDVAWQLRISCIFFMLQKALGSLVYGSQVGALRLQRDHQILPLVAPYWIESLAREFLLPPWLGGRKISYIPAGQAISSKDLERHPDKRLPFWQRVYHLFFCRGVWMHGLLIVLALTSIAYRSFVLWKDPSQNASALVALVREETGNDDALPPYFDCFILYCGYPPLWAIYVLQHSFAAVLYVFFPPTNPKVSPVSKMLWQLENNQGNNVYIGRASRLYVLLWEIPNVFMFAYCVVVLVWTRNW